MDKNTWIGFLLIAAIIVGFSMLNRPSQEEMAERQRRIDSIALAERMRAEAQRLSDSISQYIEQDNRQNTDREQTQMNEEQMQAVFGSFAPSASGEEKTITLENEKLKLYIQSKGGYISRVELKEYHAYGDSVNPLHLFGKDETKLAFTLLTGNNRIITTDNLFFEPVQTDAHQAVMRLKTVDDNSFLDFVYTLRDNDYMVGFDIVAHNLNSVLAQNTNSLDMQWMQRVPQQERGRKFEERYAQLQYMLVGGDMEQLSEQKSDSKKESARVRWISTKTHSLRPPSNQHRRTDIRATLKNTIPAQASDLTSTALMLQT